MESTRAPSAKEMFTPNCLRAIINDHHDSLREKEVIPNDLFAAHIYAGFARVGPLVDGATPIRPRYGRAHGQTDGPPGSLGTSLQRTLCGRCCRGRIARTDNLWWGAGQQIHPGVGWLRVRIH